MKLEGCLAIGIGLVVLCLCLIPFVLPADAPIEHSPLEYLGLLSSVVLIIIGVSLMIRKRSK